MATPYDEYRKYLTKSQVNKLVDAQSRFNNQHADERNEMAVNNQQMIDQQRRFLQNRGLASNPGNLISGEEPRFRVPVVDAFNKQNEQLRMNEDAQTKALAANYAAKTRAARAQAAAEREAYENYGEITVNGQKMTLNKDDYLNSITNYDNFIDDFNHTQETSYNEAVGRAAAEVRQAAAAAQSTAKEKLSTEDYNRMQSELARAGLSGYEGDIAKINAAQMAMNGDPYNENRMRWKSEMARLGVQQRQQFLNQNETYRNATDNIQVARDGMQAAQDHMAEIERQMDALHDHDTITQEEYNALSSMQAEWLDTQNEYDRMKNLYAESLRIKAAAESGYYTLMDDQKYIQEYSKYSDEELEAMAAAADKQSVWTRIANIGGQYSQAEVPLSLELYDPATAAAEERANNINAALLARLVGYRKMDMLNNCEAWSASLPDHATAEGYAGDWHSYDFDDGTESIYYRAVVDNDVLQEINDVFRRSYDTNIPSRDPDVVHAINEHSNHETDFFYAEYAGFMTEDERQVFVDLYQNQGATAADKYFEALMIRLDDRAANNVSDEAKAEAETKGWFLTALKSVGVNFGNAISGPLNNIYYSARGYGVTKTQAYKNDYAQLLREAILPENEVGNLFASTALSMMDSSVAALLSKAVPGLGGVLLGSSAYNSALREAMDRGITGTRAQATAIMAGVNEMLFEEISLEKLLKFREAGTLKEAILNVLGQAFTEGSEEFCTDVANAYTDYLINGGQSELYGMYEQYMKEGNSSDEAFKKVAGDFGKQLGMSFLGGAISGGFMGSGAQITQNTAARMTQSSSSRIQALGNALLNTGDKTARVATSAQLNERGAQIRQDTKLVAELEGHQYMNEEANDLAADTGKNNVELARLEQQYNYEQNVAKQTEGITGKTGAVNNLMNRSYTSDDAREIVQRASGNVENLNNQDVAQLYAARVYEDLQPVNGLLQDAQSGSIMAIQQMVTGNAITEKQAEVLAKDNAGVAAVEQITGTQIAKAENGTIAPAAVMAAVNAKAAEVADTYGSMQLQNDIINDRIEKAVKKHQKDQADDRREAKHAEKQRSPFLDKRSVISGDDKTQTIKTSHGNTVTIKLREGSVRFLDERAKATVDMCRILAELDPQLNIIVRDTFEDENTSLDETPNGKYYNNTIEIALDAYDSLHYTTFHEFTHHLEAVSPEAFALYKRVVIDEVNKGDITEAHSDIQNIINDIRQSNPNMTAWQALVENKRRQYAKDENVKAEMEKAGKKFTFADAEKEVLADIGARMIDTDAVKNALAEETGLKTAKTIRDWFRNLKWSIKNMIKEQFMDPAEVQFLDQTAADYGAIANAYAKLIQETSRKRAEEAAARARMEAEAADPVNQEYQGDNTVRDSIRSFSHAAGIKAVKDQKTGLISFEIDGQKISHVEADHIKTSGLGALITYAADVSHTISEQEADIQYQAAADIMNMIMNTQNPEMVWAYAGSTLFSALKSNADGQYGTTIDFTTVCRKTQEMITAMSEAMKQLGRGLTRQEVTELQGRLHNAGSEVPCPVCYVFSRWAGIGSVLDKIRDAQERWSPDKVDDAALRTRVAELTKEINARKLIKDEDGKFQTQTKAINQLKEETDQELEAVRAALSALDTEYDGLSREREKLQMKDSSFENSNARLSELQQRLQELEQDRDILGEYVWIKDVRMQKDYTPVDLDVLYDLDNAADFSSKWPAAWKYRTTRGPATGKAILPYSDMRLGDVIMGVKSNSSTGNKKFAEVKDGKFNAQQARAITSAIVRTRAQNLIGGQRFQSTSDFRYEYALDYLQTFWEMQALGSKLQTYTKVIEFADFIASIGGDVNLSVMPRGKGYQGNVLDFSSVTGINVKAAREANAKYDNVQLILVGINDQHIMLALEDSTETGGADIGFVIPWHASGANAEFTQALVENLGEDYTRKNYQNYEAVQTDHERKDRTELQKDRADLRKYILTAAISGKNKFNLSEAQLQWMQNEAAQKTDIMGMSFEKLREIELKALNGDQEAIRQYSSWTSDALLNLYQKIRVPGGEEFGVKLSSTQAAAVMPHEYWNKNTTRDNAYINGFLFRSYCNNLGLHPRFTGMTSSGSKVDYGDFSSSKGYWKTLIDRPMYRNAENGGTYREQQKINVTGFDKTMLRPEYAERVYPDYKIQEPDKQRAITVGQAFAEAKTQVQFQPRGAAVQKIQTKDRNLVVAFNMGLDPLIDALQSGAIGGQSIAVYPSKYGNTEYGLFGLFMPHRIVDPKNAKGIRIFNRDSFTAIRSTLSQDELSQAKTKEEFGRALGKKDKDFRYLIQYSGNDKELDQVTRAKRNDVNSNILSAGYAQDILDFEGVKARRQWLLDFNKKSYQESKDKANADIKGFVREMVMQLSGKVETEAEANQKGSWTSRVAEALIEMASHRYDEHQISQCLQKDDTTMRGVTLDSNNGGELDFREKGLGMPAELADDWAKKLHSFFIALAERSANYLEIKSYDQIPVERSMVAVVPSEIYEKDLDDVNIFTRQFPYHKEHGKKIINDEYREEALQYARERLSELKDKLFNSGITMFTYENGENMPIKEMNKNRIDTADLAVSSIDAVRKDDDKILFQSRSRAQMQHQVDSEVGKLTDDDLMGIIIGAGGIERNKVMYAFNPVERVLDKVANGNPELRQKLYEMIERPFNQAGGNYARGRNAMAGALTAKMKELGIKTMDQSAAIQHYGERTKEFRGHVVPTLNKNGTIHIKLSDQKGQIVQEMDLTEKEVRRGFYSDAETILSIVHADPGANGPKQADTNYRPYTLEMLKEDMPTDWENIIKAEQYIRSMYDGYIKKINQMLTRVYPWVYEQDEYREDKLTEKLNNARAMVDGQNELIGRLSAALDTARKAVADDEQARTNVNTEKLDSKIRAQQKLVDDLQRNLDAKRSHYDARKSTASQAAADERAMIDRLDAKLQLAQLRLEQMQEEKQSYSPKNQRSVDREGVIRKAEGRLNSAKAKLLQLQSAAATAEVMLSEFQKARENGDTQRNKRLMPRDNYFHHFRELQSELGSIQHILRMNSNIAPALAGKTDETKPRGKWTAFLQERRGAKYRADAVNGAYIYIANAEYILAYDPVVAEMRDLETALRQRADQMHDSDIEVERRNSTNMNSFLIWLKDWTNALAGKSSNLDRFLADHVTGTRKFMQLLSALNGRVAKAKLFFNVRSAMVQASNMTNVMGYVSAQDWGKAFLLSLEMSKNEELQAVFGRSNFVTQRLMEQPEFHEEHALNPMKFGEWMLGALDRVSSTVSWWAAYNQYNRIGAEGAAKKGYRQYDSAEDYADDIVRRTHGGRGVGEIPLVLQDKFITAMAPFQVEVLNTYQNALQLMGKKKQGALGLAKMEAGIFAFNMAFRILFGDGVLGFDFIHALLASIKKWIDPKDEDDPKEKALYTSREFLGEFAAGVPFATQVFSFLMPDNALREWLFGEDQDPTRYGTGTLGFSALSNVVKIGKDAIEGKNILWDVVDATVGNFVTGGAQISRTAKGLEAFFKGYGNNNTGKVQYALDQDFGEFLQSLFFGKWSTPEAREYLKSLDPIADAFYQESGFRLLDEDKTAAYKQFVKGGGKGKDFFKLVAACNSTKADKDENGKSIEGTAAVKKLAVIDSYKLSPELREQMARMYVISDSKTKYLNSFEEAGGKSDDFIDILAEYVVMTADKNADGKVISGSKKQKYEDLLDRYKLTDAQRDVLMGMYGN